MLIGGLCSGCLWMSLTCGSQCFANLLYRYFYGGHIACDLEAFFHISAILVQFFCVALIAFHLERLVVRTNFSGPAADWKPRSAAILVALVWTACIAVTYILSLWSPIYLMSAGTHTHTPISRTLCTSDLQR